MILYCSKTSRFFSPSFLCILGFFSLTIPHTGGHDYLIYERYFENISESSYSEIFKYASTEMLLFQFFIFANILNFDFQWTIFLCVVLLYLVIYFFIRLNNKKDAVQYSMIIATLLASAAAPYLYANVIRQGLSVIVLGAFFLYYFKYNSNSSLLYSAFVDSSVFRYISNN